MSIEHLSHLAKWLNLRPGPTVTGGVTWLVDLGTKKVSYAKPPLTEFEFDIFTQSNLSYFIVHRKGSELQSVSQWVGVL